MKKIFEQIKDSVERFLVWLSTDQEGFCACWNINPRFFDRWFRPVGDRKRWSSYTSVSQIACTYIADRLRERYKSRGGGGGIINMEPPREYWMIYRGPGLLCSVISMIWFLPSNLLPLSCQQIVSLSQSSCVSPFELTDGKGGRRGWGRSRSHRRRESLVLYKLFNTLWSHHFKVFIKHFFVPLT